MNDEHKLNYVNLRNTPSEQSLGGDLSYDKYSQATCTAMTLYTSTKSTLNIVMILDSQLSVTAHTALQIKSPEAKVC